MNWLKTLLGARSRKSASPNVATLKKEPGDLYVLRIGGVLNKATVDNIQGIAAREIDRGSTDLKVLLVMDDFRGWTRGDDWSDLSFFAQYEANIAKIAAVGAARWETETLIFLGSGHRQGAVRYFGEGQEEEALAWLSG